MENFFTHVLHPVSKEKFSLPLSSTQDLFNSAILYQPDDSDIFICSYPKCGTTWLQNIVWLITRNGQSVDTNVDLFDQLPFLEFVDSALIKNIDNSAYPRIIKTHLPQKWLPRNPKSKYLFIARDPRDVAVSTFYHHLGFEQMTSKFSFNEIFETFLAGKSHYGDYFDFLQSYLDSKDSNVLTLFYEDLQKDLGKEILKIAKFLGPEYEENLMLNEIIKKSHISEMKKNTKHWCPKPRRDDWPFIRKGLVGDWKNHLTNEQAEQLRKRLQETVPQLEQFWFSEN